MQFNSRFASQHWRWFELIFLFSLNFKTLLIMKSFVINFIATWNCRTATKFRFKVKLVNLLKELLHALHYIGTERFGKCVIARSSMSGKILFFLLHSFIFIYARLEHFVLAILFFFRSYTLSIRLLFCINVYFPVFLSFLTSFNVFYTHYVHLIIFLSAILLVSKHSNRALRNTRCTCGQ